MSNGDRYSLCPVRWFVVSVCLCKHRSHISCTCDRTVPLLLVLVLLLSICIRWIPPLFLFVITRATYASAITTCVTLSSLLFVAIRVLLLMRLRIDLCGLAWCSAFLLTYPLPPPPLAAVARASLFVVFFLPFVVVYQLWSSTTPVRLYSSLIGGIFSRDSGPVPCCTSSFVCACVCS